MLMLRKASCLYKEVYIQVHELGLMADGHEVKKLDRDGRVCFQF